MSLSVPPAAPRRSTHTVQRTLACPRHRHTLLMQAWARVAVGVCVAMGVMCHASQGLQPVVLFHGVASNQWSALLSRNVHQQLARLCEEALERSRTCRLITRSEEIAQLEKTGVDPRTALGAALSIVRAGRIDYHTYVGTYPKYFLAVSFDVFDPVTGYMLASFPHLATLDPKQEFTHMTTAIDERAYAALVWSLTNALMADVLHRFQPAILTLTAERESATRARIARPRAHGLGLNDMLYDDASQPYVITAIGGGWGTLEPVEHQPAQLPQTFRLYAKRVHAPHAQAAPMRLQVLKVLVPRACPAAVFPGLDQDDIEISGTVKLHTGLARSGRVPMLYPAPLGGVTKRVLARATEQTRVVAATARRRRRA